MQKQIARIIIIIGLVTISIVAVTKQVFAQQFPTHPGWGDVTLNFFHVGPPGFSVFPTFPTFPPRPSFSPISNFRPSFPPRPTFPPRPAISPFSIPTPSPISIPTIPPQEL